MKYPEADIIAATLDAIPDFGMRAVHADILLSQTIGHVVFSAGPNFTERSLACLYEIAEAVHPQVADVYYDETPSLERLIIDSARLQRDKAVHFHVDDSYHQVISDEKKAVFNRLIALMRRKEVDYADAA